MEEQDPDQQVGAPGVDRTEEPAEIDLGHDRAHAFEGLIGRRLIVDGQEYSRHYLDRKQKEGHSAQEIEDRRAVERDVFLGGQRGGRIESQPLEEKVLHDFHPRPGFRANCQTMRETMISSCPGFPLPFTALYISSGRGGGPETLRPLMS